MTWVKLDDKLFSNPKIIELSKDAKLLYISGLTYCAANFTDGKLTPGAVRVAASLVDVNPSRAKELVNAHLWEATQDGFAVHDYLTYNPSAEQVKRERTMNQTRKDLYSDPFLLKRIKARDGDHCRYCHKYVRWTDRKSAHGGTFDHVDPGDGNTLENLVVACRGCNSGKGSRTPDQASMTLLAPYQPRSDLGSEQITSSSDLDEIYTPVPVPVPVTLTSNPEVITHTVNAPCDGAECASGPDPVESKAEPAARSPGRDRAQLAASFDRWWAIWLKRVDRANALRVWLRLAPDDELVAAILAATVAQNRARYSKVELQFVPGPAKWLRGRMWEDEVIAIEETGRETNRHDYARARLTAGAAGSAGPGGHDSWADEG